MGLRDWGDGPKKRAAADAALREAIANGRLWVLDAALEAHRSEASEEVLGLARAARKRLKKKRKKEKEEARVKAEAEAAARAPAEAEGDVVLLAEIPRGWHRGVYERQSQSRADAMLGVYELQRDEMKDGLPVYRKSGTDFLLYHVGSTWHSSMHQWRVAKTMLGQRWRQRWNVASSARTPGAITEPWNGWNGKEWVEVPSAKIVTLAAFKAEAKKRKAAEEAAEAKKRKDAKEAAEAKKKIKEKLIRLKTAGLPDHITTKHLSLNLSDKEYAELYKFLRSKGAPNESQSEEDVLNDIDYHVFTGTVSKEDGLFLITHRSHIELMKPFRNKKLSKKKADEHAKHVRWLLIEMGFEDYPEAVKKVAAGADPEAVASLDGIRGNSPSRTKTSRGESKAKSPKVDEPNKEKESPRGRRKGRFADD